MRANYQFVFISCTSCSVVHCSPKDQLRKKQQTMSKVFCKGITPKALNETNIVDLLKSAGPWPAWRVLDVSQKKKTCFGL